MRRIDLLVLTAIISILLILPTPQALFDNADTKCLPLPSQSAISGVSNGHTLINMTYPQSGLQTASSVVQRDDGGFILGGYDGSGVNTSQMLLGTDSTGAYEWNVTLCPGATIVKMIKCRDGGYALLGSILPEGAEYYDMLLSRVNSAFEYQWNQTYGGAGFDYPSGIVELGDGFLIGGTYTNTSRADSDYILIRTDINGTQLWNVTYGDAEDQRCSEMIQCSDGNLLLCGSTWSLSTLWNIWLVKTDPAGTLLWNRTYSTSMYDTAQSIVELQDGGYAITGGISTGSEGDLLLLRTDSNGHQLWNRTFSQGPNQEYTGYSLVNTLDLGLCILGMSTDSEHTSLFWLIRTDYGGNRLWDYQLGQRTVSVSCVINAPDGGFITAGATGEYGTNEWDFRLMLFPELSWVQEPSDQVWFIDVSPFPIYQLNATSAATIQSWQVNDTHFSIDSQGLLRNATILNGTYYLLILVTDSVNNILSSSIVIYAIEHVDTATTPGPTSLGPVPFPFYIVIELVAVSLFSVVVIVLLIRFRKYDIRS
jgi:hypothetical protein